MSPEGRRPASLVDQHRVPNPGITSVELRGSCLLLQNRTDVFRGEWKCLVHRRKKQCKREEDLRGRGLGAAGALNPTTLSGPACAAVSPTTACNGHRAFSVSPKIPPSSWGAANGKSLDTESSYILESRPTTTCINTQHRHTHTPYTLPFTPCPAPTHTHIPSSIPSWL